MSAAVMPIAASTTSGRSPAPSPCLTSRVLSSWSRFMTASSAASRPSLSASARRARRSSVTSRLTVASVTNSPLASETAKAEKSIQIGSPVTKWRNRISAFAWPSRMIRGTRSFMTNARSSGKKNASIAEPLTCSRLSRPTIRRAAGLAKVGNPRRSQMPMKSLLFSTSRASRSRSASARLRSVISAKKIERPSSDGYARFSYQRSRAG